MAAIIKIKRSSGTAAPGSLYLGELAVTTGSGTESNEGGRLFVGAAAGANGSAGTDIRTIGGEYYVGMIDSATSANDVSQLVRRDQNGDFVARQITASLIGNADTTTKLQTPRTIEISGDISGSVSFDGTANVNISSTLPNINNNTGSFGSSTEIPTITINAKGQVTGASTNTISTDFSIKPDDEGTGITVAGGSTLKIKGGTGITTEVKDGDTVEVDIDDDVVTTTGIQTLTSKSISGSTNNLTDIANDALVHSKITIKDDGSDTKDVPLGTEFSIIGTSHEIETDIVGNSIKIGLPDNVVVSGNLTVNGTTTTVDSQNLSINDPIIELANGNDSSDGVDIGFYGTYYDGSNVQYTGFFRDQTDKQYYLLHNLGAEPDNTFTGSGSGGVIEEADLATLNVVLDGGDFSA